MDKLVNNMQEYVESVFNLKKKGENSYFPVENLSLFSQELHNQATANWIYDIRSELTIPPDNEE